MTLLDRRGFAIVGMLLLTGCSKQELPGGPRLETHPVKGIVHVDGKPAENVEVGCHPDADSSGIKYSLSTLTNKDGVFELTTYQSSDGLPEGTYTLSFKWLGTEMSFVPQDLLKGAYADPKNSQHKITVVKGKETEVGIIELSSKGPG